MSFVSLIGRNLINIPGKAVDRKILVIESDDWGSVRMPSTKVFDTLNALGIPGASNPFNRFDSLESEEDLSRLFQAQSKYRDRNGNPPTITANFIVTNPVFEKIVESGYKDYYSEVFTETYKRNPGTLHSFSAVKNGIDNKYLFPQYHGREHINVHQWMALLENGNRELRKAAEHGTFAIDVESSDLKRSNLMASFDHGSEAEKSKVLSSVKDGYRIFEEVFGFKSKSFIAPCYVWDEAVEQELSRLGARIIQSSLVQNIPKPSSRPYKKVYRFTGNRNKFKQTYLARNCYFELSTRNNYDWVANCMEKMEVAFFWKKPVILSMHRLNFIGSLVKENRENNLKTFERLLAAIVKKWPDIEFMSSVDLGELLLERNS